MVARRLQENGFQCKNGGKNFGVGDGGWDGRLYGEDGGPTGRAELLVLQKK